jgi:hypothetical protein
VATTCREAKETAAAATAAGAVVAAAPGGGGAAVAAAAPAAALLCRAEELEKRQLWEDQRRDSTAVLADPNPNPRLTNFMYTLTDSLLSF